MNRKPSAIRKASQYSQPSFLSREEFIKIFYPRLIGLPLSHCSGENFYLWVSATLWQKLGHFVNGHISLLKSRFQKTTKFILIHGICTSFQVTDEDIADVVTLDDVLCSCPIWAGIKRLDVSCARALQSMV